MPKKTKKKKSWKERQRERQKAQEAEQIRLEVEKKYKGKDTGWPKGKILGAFCLIILIFGAYWLWQSTQPAQPSTAPPPINPTNPLQTPYEFTMRDINGTQFSLRRFSGNVIVIHLMGVGCGGQIDQINDNQLTHLRTVCSSFCGKAPVTLITVAVSTCGTCEPLLQLRDMYTISWLFGNDFDDGKADIAQKYATHGDGTIVLIDKAFHISDSYSTIIASTLSQKINQLLGG